MVDARDLKSLGFTAVRVQVPLWVPQENQGFTSNFRIVCGPFFCAIFQSCPTPVPPFSSKETVSNDTIMQIIALLTRTQRHALVSTYTSSIHKTKRGCMTSKIVPSQRGKGRVEYLGLIKDIEQNLLAGHTKKAIHCHLVAEGKITISYQRFCHYVKQYSPHCMPAGKNTFNILPSKDLPP